MSIVQSLWIGRALPALQQLSIRSFLAQGHEYHLYAYGEVRDVPDGAKVCEGASILPGESIFCYQEGSGKGSYSAFSNLFRYKLLLDRGGWWVDTDLICLRPFAFDDPFVFGLERDDDGTVHCATSAFKSPAGAPFLQYCLDVAMAADKQTLQWGQIGPFLLEDAVQRYQLTSHCMPVETFNPIDFVDFQSLVSPGFDMARLARSYSVHLWNEMWRRHGSDPEASPPPDSLYGILREKYVASAMADPVDR